MNARTGLAVATLIGLLAGCATVASPSPTPTPEEVSPTPSPVPPSGPLLPNLVMDPLKDWRIEVDDEGHRLLRLQTAFANIGVGRFELRGSRPDTSTDTMALDQLVYTATGGFSRRSTGVGAGYGGDDHDHWHAQGVVTMALSPLGDPTSVTAGSKVNFCFFDNRHTYEDMADSPAHPYYDISWCGTPDSYGVRMGLSVGWSDVYGWTFAYQWVDITDLPGGTYELRVTVDAANDFVESNDTDNCTMATIFIPDAGEGLIVEVEVDGQAC